MMWKTRIFAQTSALPAIAAALALSPTPAWSQEAQPVSIDPVVTTPAPTVDSAPATADTAAPAAEPSVAADMPAAPAKATAVPKKTRTAAPKAPVKGTARAAAPAAAPAVAATAAPAPAAPSTPQPIVDARPPENAAPAPAAETAKSPSTVDETTMMMGGGALALLALGGGAFALTRRRREEDEVVDEPMVDEFMTAERPRAAPVHEEQPAIVEPSAFSWGNAQPAEPKVEHRAGETWEERALRGPTPDNPSLSLRKRLKRAAFFDAREREIAAGRAEPLPADAGLPEAAVEARELELA